MRRFFFEERRHMTFEERKDDRAHRKRDQRELILPRFRGHPETREHARGVFDGEKGEGTTRSPSLQPGVQG
jgi:hypothetical protein